MNFKKRRTQLVILVFICFLIRAAHIHFLTQPENYIFSDMKFYDYTASQILELRYSLFSTHNPPAYYLFLATSYLLLKVVGLYAQKYVLIPYLQAAISSICVVFVYLTAERIGGKKSAIASSLMYAVFYPIICLNSFLVAENIFISLLLASFYIIVCRIEKAGKKWQIALGTCLALASMTKTLFLTFTLVFLGWHYINFKDKRSSAIIASTIMLLFLASSLLNLWATGGEVFFISSGGGSGFVMSWCDLKYLNYQDWIRFQSPSTYDYPDSRGLKVDFPFTQQGRLYQMGVACIMENPKRIITNTKNIIRLFDSRMFPDEQSIPYYPQLFNLYKIISIALIIPLSFMAYYFSKGENKKYVALILLTLPCLFASIYLQGVGEERYLIPYTTLLIILAPLGAKEIIEKTKIIYPRLYLVLGE